MPRFTDDAIVIRTQEWSETSQIVTLLTRRHGKVRGLAKGAKRLSPSSLQRFSGGFELLTLGQVVAITRPSTELASLVEWDLQDPLRHLRLDLRAQELGLYAADAVNAMIADEDEHAGVYEAMVGFVRSMGEDHAPAWSVGLLRFQWALLAECGYRPELDRDVIEGDALAARASYHFDPVKGGLTLEERPGAWKVRRETVELLRGFANRSGASQRLSPRLGEEVMRRANRLLCVYIRAILDKELPTMRFVLGGI